MATFEQLQKANETIRTTNIKGKEYAEVNQRIKAFRMVYPDGVIKTEMISNVNGVCIFKASIYSEISNAFDCLLATGHAYEKESSSFINKTSYIENCETSAVGRALGLAGFGIDTSVASAEEVGNAIANQDADRIVSPNMAKRLEEIIMLREVNPADVLAFYKHDTFGEFTTKEYAAIMLKLNEENEKGAEHE